MSTTRATIVAIDGPAGTGKSTVGQALARELGLPYVDTGAMYRVVGLLARDRGVDPTDVAGLTEIVDRLDVRFAPREDGEPGVLADGRDVTREIRQADVGQWASKVSAVPAVRERLVARQREIGAAEGGVFEGRDIGTVVFPDAAAKFFLDASADERAGRRHRDLDARGQAIDLAEIRAEIVERDERDRSREHSPLRPADDSVVLDTTALSFDEVVEELVRVCRAAGLESGPTVE